MTEAATLGLNKPRAQFKDLWIDWSLDPSFDATTVHSARLTLAELCRGDRAALVEAMEYLGIAP